MERWENVKGYEGLYLISDLGTIKTIKTGRLKIAITTPNGYSRVCLSKDGKRKMFFVHRLVADAFIENPYNKPQVNHINGIKKDNKAINLEWVTLQENNKHAHSMGLVCDNRGIKNGQSKLTAEKVNEIRDLYKKGGISQKKLSEMFEIAQARISEIVNYKAWVHIK